MLIDIFLILSVVLIARLGWLVGFTKTFFTVSAGFLAIFIASKYSCGGLSLYLIFAIIALLVIILGCFAARLLNFLYMGFLDRIGGLALNVCIWLILCVNVIIPVMTQKNYISNVSKGTIYKSVSYIVRSKIPLFKNHVLPEFSKQKL